AGIAELARRGLAALGELAFTEALLACVRIAVDFAVGARRAGLAGVEVVERTRVGRPEEQVHGVVPQFDRAASEAIASGRNVRRAGVQACLGLRLHARARVALPIPA